jgi:hypothetical protein
MGLKYLYHDHSGPGQQHALAKELAPHVAGARAEGQAYTNLARTL